MAFTSLEDDFLVSKSIGFADVLAGKRYVEPINAVADSSFMNGVGDSLFKTDQVTTRSELAGMVYDVFLA